MSIDWGLPESSMVTALLGGLAAFAVLPLFLLARRAPPGWIWRPLGSLGLLTGVMVLITHGLGEAGVEIKRIGAVMALGSLLAGYAVAIQAGRDDPAGKHWRVARVGLDVALVVVLALSVRLRMMGPESLEDVEFVAAPAGSCVLAFGRARWPESFDPVFLHDAVTGRSLRLKRTARLAFSANGRSAVIWLDGWRRDRRSNARLASLDVPGFSLLPIDGVDGLGTRGLLSASGRTLLVLPDEDDIHTAVDAPTGFLRGRYTQPGGSGSQRWWIGDDGAVRLVRSCSESRTFEHDVVELYAGVPPGPALRLVARLDRPPGTWEEVAFFPDPRFTRIVASWRGPTGHVVALHAWGDPAIAAVLDEGGSGSVGAPAFLDDGRIVLERAPGDRHTLRLFAGDGRIETEWDLPFDVVEDKRGGYRSVDASRAPAEAAPGRVLLEGRRLGRIEVLLFDLNEGRVVGEQAGLQRIAHRGVVAMGGPASRFFRASEGELAGALVELDWDTGERRVVIAASSRPAD